MCIAILKKKNGKITEKALINSFNSNPDGAGIAYTIKNKLIIEKGFFSVDEFVNAVKLANEVCDNNMLIHCRIGTSGLKDDVNCHPFKVHEDLALIHNGILDINVPKKSKINDTQIYINENLKSFTTEDLMTHKGLQHLIEQHIGHNKFVMMDNKGDFVILNENLGHWNDNVWYSNDSYKDRIVYPTFWGCNYDYDDSYEFDDLVGNEELSDEERDVLCDNFYFIEDAIYESEIEDLIKVRENPYYDIKEDMLVSGMPTLEDGRYVRIPKGSYLSDYISDRIDEFVEDLMEKEPI